MPRGGPMLTDGQWKKIEPLLPKLRKSKQGGCPWADSCRVLESILWIARRGAGGRTCPLSILPQQRAGGTYATGKSAEFG